MAYAATDYQYNSAGVEPPTGNQIRSNAAALSTSTLLWVRDLGGNGLDNGFLWHSVMPGYHLVVHDWDDASRHVRFDVIGLPVIKAGYTEIPVVVTSVGPTGEPPAQRVQAILLTDEWNLPPGGQPGDVLVKETSVDGDAEWVTPSGGGGNIPVGVAGCQEWPVAWPCSTDGVDPLLLDAAQSLAGQLLWALSGYRVGLCIFREAFIPSSNGGCGYPYKDRNGNWHNGGRSGGMCCRVLLTHRPVEAVTEVSDGGTVLDPANYTLEGSWLRKRDGCWATIGACDDPELIVTYQAGVPFPAGTAAAAGEVACEYLTALQGGQCRLPSRATSITRQGVTVTLDTADEFVGRGRIGLPVTDAWLESVVGIGPRVASRVYSPDVPKAVRV